MFYRIAGVHLEMLQESLTIFNNHKANGIIGNLIVGPGVDQDYQ